MWLNDKRGASILTENVMFIILNLVFLGILIAFIFGHGGNLTDLEESYAKNIALLIDSGKPLMTISLNMEKGKELAEKNNFPFTEIVKINGNIVTVKLSPDSSYSYDFFNDVDVSVYPDGNNIGNYIIKINEYN